jgi:hypothetical protein
VLTIAPIETSPDEFQPAREENPPRYRLVVKMSEDALPEERITALLAMLTPAPAAWVEAAKQLPAARAQIDGIVARAEQDAEYRARLVSDLEQALVADGIEPTIALQRELIRRLAND